MRVLKSLGWIIALYIAAHLMIGAFFPGAASLMPLINVLMSCVFLLAVLSAFTGGESGVLRGIRRGFGLFIGLIAVMIFLAAFIEPRSAAAESGVSIIIVFIQEVIPLGSIFGALIGVPGVIPSYVIGLASDVAKLLLQMMLNPIIIGLVFEFLFSSKRDRDESDKSYALRNWFLFTRQEGVFVKCSTRGILASFFGTVYSAYAAAFVFNGLIALLGSALGISRIKCYFSIFLFIVIIGLVLLRWRLPVVKPGASQLFPVLGEAGLWKRLWMDIGKTLLINFIVIFILSRFAG